VNSAIRFTATTATWHTTPPYAGGARFWLQNKGESSVNFHGQVTMPNPHPVAQPAPQTTAPANQPQQQVGACPPGTTPQFVLGFADLRAQVGDAMGNPTECEHANPDNGDTLQQTTTGLAFYRKSTNTPTFTNGSDHWGLTSNGLVAWSGVDVDPPSTAQAISQPGSQPTRVPLTADDRAQLRAQYAADQDQINALNLQVRLRAAGVNDPLSPDFGKINVYVQCQLLAVRNGQQTSQIQLEMIAIRNALLDGTKPAG
jgi:hypothetical protein